MEKLIHYFTSETEAPIVKKCLSSWESQNDCAMINHLSNVDNVLLDDEIAELYHSLSNWGIKSDILRYCIIYKFGGVWIDHDVELLDSKAFEKLITTDSFIGIDTFSPYATVEFFGSKKNNPTFLDILEHIKNTIKDIKSLADIPHVSGPIGVYKLLEEKPHDLITYPLSYLYRYSLKNHMKAVYTREAWIEENEVAIAQHHWYKNWMKNLKI